MFIVNYVVIIIESSDKKFNPDLLDITYAGHSEICAFSSVFMT